MSLSENSTQGLFSTTLSSPSKGMLGLGLGLGILDDPTLVIDYRFVLILNLSIILQIYNKFIF